MNRLVVEAGHHPLRAVGASGLILAVLVTLATFTFVSTGLSLSLTPDKWFVIAAFVVLKVYLELSPEASPAQV